MELQTAAGGAARPQSGRERPIDLVHLARMTLGDRGVEREVLALFSRQGPLLLVRMRQVEASGDRAGVKALAHALKGSASGLGAWHVAKAATAVEAADDARHLTAALEALDAALQGACGLIKDLLQPQ